MVENSGFYSVFNVLIPIAGLTINVIIQVLSFRHLPKLGLLKSIFMGFSLGMLFIIILQAGLYNLPSASGPVALATNITIYGALAYCYFHFLNLGETARRIRIVRELYDSPNGLSMEELLRNYNSKDMVNMRINRLLSNGQIIYKDGSYFIGKPIMLWMARIILLMKRILLGKTGNFKI